jgi:hypothetical protein
LDIRDGGWTFPFDRNVDISRWSEVSYEILWFSNVPSSTVAILVTDFERVPGFWSTGWSGDTSVLHEVGGISTDPNGR